jgi:hypothetical protein
MPAGYVESDTRGAPDEVRGGPCPACEQPTDPQTPAHPRWCTVKHAEPLPAPFDGCEIEPCTSDVEEAGPVGVWLRETPDGPVVVIDAPAGAVIPVQQFADLCRRGLALVEAARAA